MSRTWRSAWPVRRPGCWSCPPQRHQAGQGRRRLVRRFHGEPRAQAAPQAGQRSPSATSSPTGPETPGLEVLIQGPEAAARTHPPCPGQGHHPQPGDASVTKATALHGHQEMDPAPSAGASTAGQGPHGTDRTTGPGAPHLAGTDPGRVTPVRASYWRTSDSGVSPGLLRISHANVISR